MDRLLCREESASLSLPYTNCIWKVLGKHHASTRRPLAAQLLGLCFGPMVEKGEWPQTQQTLRPIFLQEGLGTRYHSNCKQGLICFVDE